MPHPDTQTLTSTSKDVATRKALLDDALYTVEELADFASSLFNSIVLRTAKTP